MKKFLSVLMAATMLVGVMALTGCGGDTTEPTTDEANNQSEPASTTATDLKTVTEGVLTMSTNAAFPPYEMPPTTAAMWWALTRTSQRPSRKSWAWSCRLTTWTLTPPWLAAQSGKSDIVMAGVTVNEDRQLVMDFTDTYATGVQVVIVPEGSDITSIEDNAGQAADRHPAGYHRLYPMLQSCGGRRLWRGARGCL